MFYDLKDPVLFLKKIKQVLEKNGIFHIEVAYLPEIIKNFSYDTFCQEHYEYYSLMSLDHICKCANMKIIDFGFNKINGGSIWLNISHKETSLYTNHKKITQQLKYEKKKKIDKSSTYKIYFKKVFEHGIKLNKIIKNLKNNNKEIYGVGASTKGNVLLQNSKIDNKFLKGIFDVNKEKFNCYTPYSKIQIFDEKLLKYTKVDYVLLLTWHFGKQIIKKIKKVNKNIKILIPFPKIRII